MGIVQTVLRWSDTKTSFIEKAYVWLLVVVLFGVVLHAPLSVGLGSLWPDASLLLKSWKEVVMGVAGVLLVVILTTSKRWPIFKNTVFYLIIGFAAVQLALIPLFYNGLEATLAGILINLRYFLAFTLVFAAIRLFPRAIPLFLATFAAGATGFLVFGLLQVTVLPHDILRHIGYGESTIMPYLTVDQNTDFIRINSTLRGPNPVGAYAVGILGVLLAFWLRGPRAVSKRTTGLALCGGIAAAVLVWASYSRSAALAAIVTVAVMLFVVYGKRMTRGAWAIVGVVALVLVGSLVAVRDTSFVSTVILHEDPQEAGVVNSNDEHVQSLVVGLSRMAQQPFGAGVGSTGSASLYTHSPIIIENQYLFIAHEAGWVGLLLFLLISAAVLILLWRRRREWLCLAAFATGLGLMAVGMVLPVWVDDTVSILWWSFAGLALASPALRRERR